MVGYLLSFLSNNKLFLQASSNPSPPGFIHIMSRHWTGFVAWAPDKIQRIYTGSAFAALSFNFRPRTVLIKHLDHNNLSWGWCSITPLGNFDANKGGHLVLWDLGLIIWFPRGSSILIPSAMIKHSNTPIGEGETRYSFTQYSASGLFRWVDNGFITDNKWLANASNVDKAQREEKQKTRWLEGLKMLSHISEFRLWTLC